MATLKIISNKDCKLYIDQEFVCDMSANKLVKHAIDTGIYLIDVIANDESLLTNSESFDLEIVESEQQILKRITFASAKEPVVSKEKENEEEDFSNNPNLIFYNGFARVSKNNKYGFIDRSYKWVIDPQFDEAETLRNGYSLVCKSFDGKMKLTLLDSQCKLTLGMWFDEILYKSIETFVVRRQDELFRVDIQKMIYTDVWHLEGQVFNNKPIPVSITDGVSKRYGYINNEGSTVLPFIYDYVSDFSDSGWAEVERYGIRRFINLDGDINVLNTLEDIEVNTKQFYILKLRKNYDWEEPYEWCGSLEYPDKEDLFLGGVYRFPIRKNGKWGYACLKEERYNGPNTIKMMIDCNYEQFLSGSKFGYVIAKKGEYLEIVNLIGAKYARGEKEGQYVYGSMGEILFKMKCQEMYPINEYSYEWVDYGGTGLYEHKSTFSSVVVKINGKFGLVNRQGHFIIEAKYDDIYYQKQDEKPHRMFDNKVIIIEKNNLKGLCCSDGNILIDTKYSEIYATGDMWCVKTGIDYQLFDIHQRTLLSPHFDVVNKYEDIKYIETNVVREHFICYLITKENKMGCINADGALVVECKYDKIEILKHIDLSCTKLKIRKDNHVGLLTNDGSVIIPCRYEEIIPVDGVYLNNPIYYMVRNNEKYSIWSTEGQQLSDYLYEKCSYITDDYDENYNSWNVLMVKKDGKYALIKDDFTKLTDYVFEEYKDYWINSFGTIVFAKVNQLMGIIDIKGNILVDFEYDDMHFLTEGNPEIKVKKNNKVGVISLKDYNDIECIYDDIERLSGNYRIAYIAYINSTKLLLDNKGNIIIPNYIYDEAVVFYDDDIVVGTSVKSKDSWGFVNTRGEILVHCIYEKVEPCVVNGEMVAYIITKGGKVGAISLMSETLIDCVYDNIDFEKTDKNYFFCYNTGDSWSGNPRKAMIFGSSQVIQLESVRPYDCVKELEELGY